MKEFPAHVIARAQELYQTPVFDRYNKPSQRPLTRLVSELSAEYGGDAPSRQAVQNWITKFRWNNPTAPKLPHDPTLQLVPLPPADPPPVTTVADPLDPGSRLLTDEEWDWHKRRMQFMCHATDLAMDCFSIGRRLMNGKPEIAFRGAEEALKVGVVLAEFVGKVNSGKFDPSETGSRVEAIPPGQLKQVILAFLTPGSESVFPQLPRKETIDVAADLNT